MDKNNSHAGRAVFYDKGRAEYPAAFYDWLYGELNISPNAVIADIGPATGKVTKGFLERGNPVYAVEPDEDMMRILQSRLGCYDNCTSIVNFAENTGIPSDAVDLVFCGNSYEWFERSKVIPEFKRILRSGGPNVVLCNLSEGDPGRQINKFRAHLNAATSAFTPPAMSRTPNTVAPFRPDCFTTREFIYDVYEDFDMLLNGSLSSALYSPLPQGSDFDAYRQLFKVSFDKYSRNGKIKCEFKLICMIGNVDDLAE